MAKKTTLYIPDVHDRTLDVMFVPPSDTDVLADIRVSCKWDSEGKPQDATVTATYRLDRKSAAFVKKVTDALTATSDEQPVHPGLVAGRLLRAAWLVEGRSIEGDAIPLADLDVEKPTWHAHVTDEETGEDKIIVVHADTEADAQQAVSAKLTSERRYQELTEFLQAGLPVEKQTLDTDGVDTTPFSSIWAEKGISAEETDPAYWKNEVAKAKYHYRTNLKKGNDAKAKEWLAKLREREARLKELTGEK